MEEKRVVLISDTHSRHAELNIPPCDLLIHSGDFTAHGSRDETEAFIDWIHKAPAKGILVIPGNHDTWAWTNFNGTRRLFRAKCVQYGRGHFEMQDLQIEAEPWQFSFPNQACYADPREPAYRRYKWRNMDRAELVVTHIPPKGLGDRVNRPRLGEDPAVGCPELLAIVNGSQKAALHVFGHIHEGRGMHLYPNGRTLAVNAASMSPDHESVLPPVVVVMRRSPDGSWVAVAGD